MRNRRYTSIKVGGVDYSAYLHTPLTIQRTLNEQLDSASVELVNTPFREPLKPFLPVSLGGETYILADDTVTEVLGRGLYKHSLTLIEETKEAERIICGAKAFTAPLVHDYTDGATIPRVTMFQNQNSSQSSTNIVGWKVASEEYTLYPMRYGTVASSCITTDDALRIPPVSDFIRGNDNTGVTTLTKAQVFIYYNKSGTAIDLVGKNLIVTYVGDFELADGTTVMVDGYSLTTTETPTFSPTLGKGIYTVRYDVFNNLTPARRAWSFVYDVSVVEQPAVKPTPTIAEVIHRLLITSETLRDGLDAPRYRLEYTAEQAKIMEQDAPEFHFSNGRSLWENLREVGRYIHAIPRITDGVLTFDELGGLERADLSKGQRVMQSTTVSIGDYTAGLDSLANNLINQDDLADGSVCDPFDGGYMTMRTVSEDARIQEGGGIILTSNPVEKIISLVLAPFEYKGQAYPETDITAYVFEKQEYDLLSSHTGFYPQSKTYALFYTQGGQNIDGLWYKAQDAENNILNSMKEYAITNIIEAAANVATGYLKTLPYADLAFRVTYIPTVTARVRQYKPDYDGTFPSVISYNQSANKLSAKAYGENLRGQLAMMGNTADTVTYMFPRMEDIPKAGTLYDDERYITSITARIYNDFVLAQMTLAEGYNELGAFVEVNNAIRQFEIPSSEDRYTVLEEFCEVSSTYKTDEADTVATKALKGALLDGLSGNAVGRDASLALVDTYDYDGARITDPTLALPVTTLAVGTSLYFGFRFRDNFSAGTKAATAKETTEGGKNIKYRLQDYIPYGDRFYAEAKTLSFSLVAGATGNADTPSNLPESTGVSGGTVMIDTGDHPVLWYKDSADAGCISYQLHMVTDSGFIVGDGLTYWCEAVRKQPSTEAAYIYFYGRRINQLTGTTDTSGYLYRYPILIDKTNGRIYHTGVPATAFKSWAIIKGGRFVLGKNTDKVTNNIYLNLKRRLV